VCTTPTHKKHSVVALTGSLSRHNRALTIAGLALGAYVLAMGALLLVSSFRCKKPRALEGVVVCTHGDGTYTLNVHAHRTIIVVDAVILLCQVVGVVFAGVNANCRAAPECKGHPTRGQQLSTLPSVEAQVVSAVAFTAWARGCALCNGCSDVGEDCCARFLFVW
jgi:hypothetical protein